MGRVSDARPRILEATIDLIWLGSYGAVSVDAICERAAVKKGSFYHFFKSKDELVIAALETHWRGRKPTLDALFSPTLPPLRRLGGYFDHVYRRQLELRAKYGRLPGCLFCKLGLELGKQSEIGKTVQEILSNYAKYYENALISAAAEGLPLIDIPAKAWSLFAFMEGVLAQASIHDDPELIRDLKQSAFRFLGLPTEIAA